jgi:orotidine 5'-phosphate decarboxylase subfamily 1
MSGTFLDNDNVFKPRGAAHIIVALDMDLEAALAYVKLTIDTGIHYKVGMELYNSIFVSILSSIGKIEFFKIIIMVHEFFNLTKGRIFLDLKWTDIPNTLTGVTKAVLWFIKPKFFNIMANSGSNSVKAAAENKGDSILLAVTVLTSINDEECERIYHTDSQQEVIELAFSSFENGANGVVCSTKEISLLRDKGYKGVIVTPGIKSPEELDNQNVSSDQARVGTAYGAIRAGADCIVAGRMLIKPTKGTQLEALNSTINDCLKADYENDIDSVGFTETQKKLADLLISTKTIAPVTRRTGNDKAWVFTKTDRPTSPVDFAIPGSGEYVLKLHEKDPGAPLSPIYLNLRNLPDEILDLIGLSMTELATDEMPDFCVGIPKAGVPIAKSYSDVSHIPIIEGVFEKQESDGKREIIAGKTVSGNKNKLRIVDDLVTKSLTKEEAIKAAEKEGFVVVDILVLVDREQGGSSQLQELGYPVHSVFKLTQLLSYYLITRQITQNQYNSVIEYLKNNQ